MELFKAFLATKVAKLKGFKNFETQKKSHNFQAFRKHQEFRFTKPHQNPKELARLPRNQKYR
jgi:hypothetical protein